MIRVIARFGRGDPNQSRALGWVLWSAQPREPALLPVVVAVGRFSMSAWFLSVQVLSIQALSVVAGVSIC
jgi:hypothetical protein